MRSVGYQSTADSWAGPIELPPCVWGRGGTSGIVSVSVASPAGCSQNREPVFRGIPLQPADPCPGLKTSLLPLFYWSSIKLKKGRAQQVCPKGRICSRVTLVPSTNRCLYSFHGLNVQAHVDHGSLNWGDQFHHCHYCRLVAGYPGCSESKWVFTGQLGSPILSRTWIGFFRLRMHVLFTCKMLLLEDQQLSKTGLYMCCTHSKRDAARLLLGNAQLSGRAGCPGMNFKNRRLRDLDYLTKTT